MKKDLHARKFKHARSKILYQITAILIVVFLAGGLAIFFLVRSSYENLIDKNIDKLVQSEAENIYGIFEYAIELGTASYFEYESIIGLEELQNAIKEKRLSELQMRLNQNLKDILGEGTLGLKIIMLIPVKTSITQEPILYACSDESLVYHWEVPEYLVQAIEKGTQYIWMENGIPELGLKDEHLIVIKKIDEPSFGYLAGFVGIKPMHEEILAINDFYDKEKRNTSLFLLVVVAGSMIIVVLVTFTLIRYLIHKRITKPIDELSAMAEEVMEGNLDVEIKVRKGEEFEGLKRAFKAMVESFRKIIDRSVEGR